MQHSVGPGCVDSGVRLPEPSLAPPPGGGVSSRSPFPTCNRRGDWRSGWARSSQAPEGQNQGPLGGLTEHLGAGGGGGRRVTCSLLSPTLSTGVLAAGAGLDEAAEHTRL